MPLTAGQSLSFYEILGPLGSGAMGEVYRAKDTRLDREVAIKVLPDQFSEDEERLRRFEREAKTLASLNHANVAGIHGIDQVEDTCFIAMELVPGEDLATRLSRGPLPVDEAIDVCRQIAEGLEAAHEAGIVHRDLKPANVRVTPEGVVKLLDFGLAKPIRPVATKEGTSTAKPDSFLLTEEGLVLGTPTYMSPEQARGKPVDRRTDIWAFGCVLYESLTGKRAFCGESVTDILATIVGEEPDWTQLPPLPAHVTVLLKRCLVKDPHERLRDAGDARLELSRMDALRATVVVGARGSRTVLLVVAAFAAGALLVAALAGLLPHTEDEPAGRPRRFSLHGLGLPIDAFQGLALSPDGNKLVFRSRDHDGVERLQVRDLDSFTVETLPGSELGSLPFFSPDGGRMGFYASGELKTVSLEGGLPVTIARLDGGFSGGVWLPDDTIVLTHSAAPYLARIPASGGELERLEIEGHAGVELVTSPWPLPGGEAVLCSVDRDRGAFDVAVYSLVDGSLRVIAENGFTPTWSVTGHVLFQQAGGPLMALPFDPERLAVSGDPFPVLSDVGRRVSYQVRMFTVAKDGTLAYIPGSAELDAGALVWVDRHGESEPILEMPRVIVEPRISGDGKRIAFRTPAPNCDIWVHDVERGSTSRITHEGDNHGVVWLPDDRRIAFARKEEPHWSVLAAAADGSGDVERLIPPDIVRAFASSASPDGEHLLVTTLRESYDVDLASVSEQTVEPLFASRFDDRAAFFSPDGRHIAYVSDESGRSEVYVLPFPSLDARVQVSTGGGSEPVWSPLGDALFYRTSGRLMAVQVTTSPTFSAGRPEPLFEDVYHGRGAGGSADYDVTPDGERFVMIRQRVQEGGAEIHVVLDWFSELHARDPRRED